MTKPRFQQCSAPDEFKITPTGYFINGLDRERTALCMLMPPQIKAAICIVAQRYCIPDGVGDLYFAMNIQDPIDYEFENVQVTLHPLSDYEKNSFKQLKDPPALTSMLVLKETAKNIPTLIIHGPVPRTPLPEIRGPSVSIWNINEYNRTHGGLHSDGKRISTGVNDYSWGIHCNPWLYRIRKKIERDGKSCDQRRIELLKHIKLKNLLLYKNKITKLYFGYSQDVMSKSEFISSVINDDNESKENIDICLLGKLPPGRFSGSSFLKFVEKNFEEKEFATANISFVEMHEWDEASDKFKTNFIEIRKESGRKLRLIRPGDLTQPDFVNLMIASEPFILVTGNQSTAQAITLGKILFIEPVVYQFINGLTEQAKKLKNPRAAEFLAERKKHDLPFRDTAVRDSFRELSDTIYTHFNLENNIRLNIGMWLASVEQKFDNTEKLDKNHTLLPRLRHQL